MRRTHAEIMSHPPARVPARSRAAAAAARRAGPQTWSGIGGAQRPGRQGGAVGQLQLRQDAPAGQLDRRSAGVTAGPAFLVGHLVTIALTVRLRPPAPGTK
jgi:hypothetical protein